MEHPHVSHHTATGLLFDAVDKVIKEYREPLELYLDQLLWWNKRINLVSRHVSRETVWEHIRHSLLLRQFDTYKKSSIIVDSGTGGGLPGVPLAIANENKQFVLNDIASKKIMAVKQMGKRLGLANIATNQHSIENLSLDDPFLLVSKHAFKMNDLLSMCSQMPWTELICYKGIDIENELEQIKMQLSVSVYELYPASDNSFYKDKAIVIVSR